MDIALLGAFVAASLVIALIPGPGVATIVGYALGGGRRVALAAVGGAAIGNLAAASLSLAGAGMILAQSALAFTVLKWLGAAYLIALGVYTIAQSRKPTTTTAVVARSIPLRTAFWGTAAVTALHPKTILFFTAFAPQFISLQHDYWPQAALLSLTFCLVLAVTDTIYALSAGAASAALRTSRARRWTQRAGGGVLIAAGAATAAARQ